MIKKNVVEVVLPTEKKNTNHAFLKYTYYIIVISLFLRIVWIASSDLLVEEAYYWNYAKHLDFSYLDHPPMVAVLIRLSTLLFGYHEFSVRLASLFCWLLTAFASFKLTNLMKQGAGIYSVLLLAILPFFFLQSAVMTPDQPLIACWAAAIYYFYRALVLNELTCWYAAGVWIGLGLLSKYTIILLAPAVLIYMLFFPKTRQLFFRKEPYLCLLISFLLFTPVIYWNATHEWVSFAFQGPRRFKASFSFSFHQYLALLLLFLTPLGLLELIYLCKNNNHATRSLTSRSNLFIQLFTLIPLLFFGFFSLTHSIKFNWIGPGLLAFNPWLAINLLNISQLRIPRGWLITAILSLACYGGIILAILLGNSPLLNQKVFKMFIDWHALSSQFHTIAKEVELNAHLTPILVPLDLYNLNSELSYYQEKSLNRGDIAKSYAIEGRHIFGGDSLMYQYWSLNKSLAGKILILISTRLYDFEALAIKDNVTKKSKTKFIWAYNQGGKIKLKRYYYQIVEMN